MQCPDRIKWLLDKVREASISEKNRKRIDLWAPQAATARDHWRGMPQARRQSGSIPFTIEPEIPLWSKILEFNVREFYTDPEVYLEYTLRMMLYRYEHFDEDTVVDPTITIWLGTTFESSLFGAKTIFADDASPWLDRQPLITNEEDLAKLMEPNFKTSGLMPVAHRFYSDIAELVGEGFKVTFPEWGRSPFGVAFHLMGMNNLLVSIMERPKFVHRLLRFITDTRKQWTQQRAEFLGQPVEMGNLYNDEVNSPTLSPAMYEEFALPYEIELSHFHGGILYWHSCGDTTPLMESIRKIPDLGMFHVGPWTSLSKAVQVFTGIPLEVCLDPVGDIQMADEEDMRSKLVKVMEICPPEQPVTVRADGLQLLHSLEHELSQLATWNRIACRVLRGNIA